MPENRFTLYSVNDISLAGKIKHLGRFPVPKDAPENPFIGLTTLTGCKLIATVAYSLPMSTIDLRYGEFEEWQDGGFYALSRGRESKICTIQKEYSRQIAPFSFSNFPLYYDWVESECFDEAFLFWLQKLNTPKPPPPPPKPYVGRLSSVFTNNMEK